MGLDQYVWASEKRPTTDVDFTFGEGEDAITSVVTDAKYPDCFFEDPIFGSLFVCKEGFKAIAYFRKHPNLHGAIDAIYRRKGGNQISMDSFHGNVVLDLPDIEELEKLTLADELPHTTGFFFGETGEWHTKPTLEFFKRAKEEIARGWTVWYDSSW
jgi:hypothetical protein